MSKPSKGNQDIRSFFQVKSTNKLQLKTTTPTTASKRPAKVIVSSDDDIIPDSPAAFPKKQSKVLKKRKINVVSSDSEEEKKVNVKQVKNKKEQSKATTALEVFGQEPVKQSKVLKQKSETTDNDNLNTKKKTSTSKKKKVKSRTNKTQLDIDDDSDFEKTLLELDEDLLLKSVDDLDKSVNEALEKKNNVQVKQQTGSSPEKSKPKSSNDSKKANGSNESSSETKKQRKEIQDTKAPKVTPKKEKVENQNKETKVKPSPSKYVTTSSDEGKKTSKKRPLEDDEGDPDQERYEKKRYSAMLYQKYLNRSGPRHHGSKEIPKGKPDCLKNLCFIRTGVLDSLENEEFEELVSDHGGRVVKGISKKVNYLVAGDDPGPAKIEKAKTYGIHIITEDELLDLIRSKSGLKTLLPENKDTSEDNVKSKFENEKPSSTKNCAEMVIDAKLGDIKKEVKPKIKIDSKARSSSKSPRIETKLFDESKHSSLKSSRAEAKTELAVESKNITSSSKSTTTETKTDSLPWTEKYKPINIKGIIGQQGDKSNMKRLITWLENWYKNHSGPNKPKLTRPSPWAKNDDGSYFKAALLSGPPGVGKTTTATLVAKELGFDVVEFNASDTRSKKLLHDEVSRLLGCKSLAGFFADGAEPTSKHVLLMDEVDGMAGNEDRGGMQELILLIKNSKVPIICMCNDRNHQKIRSLANYCLDLRFTRPRLEQIRGAMMSVCFKEGVKIKPEALAEVITGAGMDVRQILTHLSLWSAEEKTLSTETAVKEAKSSKKDTPLGPWEVCRKVFSAEEHKTMSIGDRSRLFYYDYSLAPLFVQDNYIHVEPHAPKEEHLKRFSLAADAISMGDLIDTKIRKSNNWSLLDVEAMCSSVLPGHYVSGHMKDRIDFPTWLGKNSRKNKFNRILSELQAHMRTSISGSKSAVNLDYVTHLRNNIVKPLVTNGVQGIGQSVEIMHSYNLLREDLDNIIELAQWPQQKNPMNMVDSKIKASFTRAFNKDSAKLPYAIQVAPVKKRSTADSQIEGLEEEEDDESSSIEDNDDITKDAMVKAKKTSKKTVKDDAPSTSKRGASGSSKGGSRKKK